MIATFVMNALSSAADMRRLLVLPLVAALFLTVWSPAADADDHGVGEARARAEQAAQELSDAETRLGTLEQEINGLEARAADAQDRLDRLRGTVQDAAIEQFINNGAEQLSFVEEDINRRARADALARTVTQGNQDAIEAYLTATAELDAASAQLVETRSDQSVAVEELKDKRAQLDAELMRLEEIERRRIEEERLQRLEEERLQRLEEQRLEREAEARAAERAARRAAAATSTTTTRPTTTTTTADSPTTTGSATRSAPTTAAPRPAAPTTAAPTTAAPTTAAPTTAAPTTNPPTTSPPTTQPPPPPPPSSSFVCPVQGPHTFIDSWGYPRSGGRSHQGVDMMASRGVPTVAPVSGRVEHRGNSLGGLSWYVYGDNGHRYYGTHLSAYANVGAGHVTAGTVIGYVGDTGNAAGNPHLHFEIHPNGGAPVNPYPTVAAACR
jgi:peptidoglycan LD-endopeptidase LytH